MKITEEYLENLPIGSKVELRIGYGTEKTVIKFSESFFITNTNHNDAWDSHQIIDIGEITKIETPSYVTEYALVLDDTEREYLSNIIKPFRDKVTYIEKKSYQYNEVNEVNEVNKAKCEYIVIAMDGITGYREDIDLPSFSTNTMYKGMKVDKKYTLEELELQED